MKKLYRKYSDGEFKITPFYLMEYIKLYPINDEKEWREIFLHDICREISKRNHKNLVYFCPECWNFVQKANLKAKGHTKFMTYKKFRKQYLDDSFLPFKKLAAQYGFMIND